MADPEITSAGTCFGFEVRSPLPFDYLRRGSGTPLLVTETDTDPPADLGDLTYEWAERPGVGLRTRLYTSTTADHLWVETAGWFRIDAGVPSITVPKLPNGLPRAWRESLLWGMPAMVCLIRRGDASIHAASVDVGGSALLLAAPGTFGKTTLAAAFLRAGHRVLSDDISCCRLAEAPAVLPGPAVLRVRRDVAERLGLPDVKMTYETDAKVNFALDDWRRGSGSPVPLKGIVFLRTWDGEPTLQRADAADALRDLLILSFKAVLDLERCFQDAGRLVAEVPVWDLRRRLDFDELPQVVDAIVRTCLGH